MKQGEQEWGRKTICEGQEDNGGIEMEISEIGRL